MHDRVRVAGSLRLGALIVALALGALLLVVLLRHPGPRCRADAPRAGGAGWVAAAIALPPCPDTGHAVYGARDDHGAPLDALDPIDDPRGGYLGVYHSPLPGGRHFEVSLARSRDLVHWTRIRVLDAADASMPTLRPVPGAHGYLLADERSHGRYDAIRVSYFADLAGLLAGHPAAARDLPLRFSRLANGTPSLLGIAWRGGLRRALVTIAFHYERTGTRRRPGVDREAIGTLTGLRTWRARRDTATDALLEAEGMRGSHGDQRVFAAAGTVWRIIEAQARAGSFASWHILLTAAGARAFVPLTLATARGRFATSFGNPIAAVLRAPGGDGDVLATTVFVFSSGAAAAEAGELVYWRRVPR